MSDMEQTSVQDPSVTAEPTAPAAPEPAAANPGPWAQDLEQRFEDPQARAAVDTYLREVWQPRVTQLEQERAQAPDGATQLWADLNSPDKAAATYLALTGELFDPELAEIVQGTLSDYYAQPDEGEALPNIDEPAPRDPEVQALIDKAHLDEYRTLVADEITKNEIPEAWADLVHPLIVSAQGDIPTGVAALRAKLENQGIIGSVTPDDVPDAPPVADPTAAAPPVAKDYGGDLNAAIDDFLAEQRAQAPPGVGSV